MTLFCWIWVDLKKKFGQPNSNKVNPFPTKSTQFQQSQPNSNKCQSRQVNPIPTNWSTQFQQLKSTQFHIPVKTATQKALFIAPPHLDEAMEQSETPLHTYVQGQGPPLSAKVSIVRIDPVDQRLPGDNQGHGVNTQPVAQYKFLL